jgi:hypothetical protein
VALEEDDDNGAGGGASLANQLMEQFQPLTSNTVILFAQ